LEQEALMAILGLLFGGAALAMGIFALAMANHARRLADRIMSDTKSDKAMTKSDAPCTHYHYHSH
jgi:hypothetical protein